MRRSIIFAICSVFLVASIPILGQEPAKKVSSYRDSLDHAIDMSDWLVQKKGLLIIPSIITEPAMGYGVAGAAVFFHSSYTEKQGPPSMSGILGAVTENGTWGFGLFHIGYWKQDRLRYMGAIAKIDANLGYYGSGRLEILKDESINLNLNSWLVFQQLKGRIGNSDFFAGGKYIFFSTDNTLGDSLSLSEFNGLEFSSTLSEASIILNYDSRNNVFSPKKGFFINFTTTYSDPWFGGEGIYGRLGTDILGYFPTSEKLMVGMRYGSLYALGDVPFWARPFVQLRGAPLMKYQDNAVTLFETEVNWNFYKRWDLVGFTGMGNAFSSYSEFENGKSVHTLGMGFRYLLMRKLGAKMGVDVAMSQDDFAVYIVFGNAWLR
ncbi:MAG: BamA/TamA family outer membrane protein [Bacteroidota bacterium]|nr:MAG: BamA/TamA family outer membrane protein [Bacteroidota bacterium]